MNRRYKIAIVDKLHQLRLVPPCGRQCLPQLRLLALGRSPSYISSLACAGCCVSMHVDRVSALCARRSAAFGGRGRARLILYCTVLYSSGCLFHDCLRPGVCLC